MSHAADESGGPTRTPHTSAPLFSGWPARPLALATGKKEPTPVSLRLPNGFLTPGDDHVVVTTLSAIPFSSRSIWNGNTPYGTGITVNGQAKVYGTVCVPGACLRRCVPRGETCARGR